jgi:hypothetical protein
MKNAQVVWGLVVASAALLGSASIARADDQKVTANVPFDFVVGDTHLRAGRYAITTLGDANSGMVAIAGMDGRQSVYTLTIPKAGKDQAAPPQLVFEKIDNQYVLTSMTLESSEGHRTVLSPANARRGTALLASRSNH